MVAEVKTSFLPYNPKMRGGVSRLRFPPGPHLRSSRFSRHPRLRQAPARRFAKNRNLRGLGGFCGEKAPGPWWAGPQALGWLPKADENPLPFSLTAPKWGVGGGEGGYPGFVSLQVPTSEAAVSADTHAFARLPPGGLRKIVI